MLDISRKAALISVHLYIFSVFTNSPVKGNEMKSIQLQYPGAADQPLTGAAKAAAWQRVCRWIQAQPTVGIPDERWSTGLADIDDVFGGGIPPGTLCEIIAPRQSCGGQTVLRHLLQVARKRRVYAALVDLGPTFDPQTVCCRTLESLLWVQCKTVKTSLQAADIIARDENLPLLLLDLRASDTVASRGIPHTAWYRFQRAVEKTSTITILFANQPVSAASRFRWEASARLQLSDLDFMPAADRFLHGKLAPSVPAVVVESQRGA